MNNARQDSKTVARRTQIGIHIAYIYEKDKCGNETRGQGAGPQIAHL
jgi:hypothetical protein